MTAKALETPRGRPWCPSTVQETPRGTQETPRGPEETSTGKVAETDARPPPRKRPSPRTSPLGSPASSPPTTDRQEKAGVAGKAQLEPQESPGSSDSERPPATKMTQKGQGASDVPPGAPAMQAPRPKSRRELLQKVAERRAQPTAAGSDTLSTLGTPSLARLPTGDSARATAVPNSKMEEMARRAADAVHAEQEAPSVNEPRSPCSPGGTRSPPRLPLLQLPASASGPDAGAGALPAAPSRDPAAALQEVRHGRHGDCAFAGEADSSEADSDEEQAQGGPELAEPGAVPAVAHDAPAANARASSPKKAAVSMSLEDTMAFLDDMLANAQAVSLDKPRESLDKMLDGIFEDIDQLPDEKSATGATIAGTEPAEVAPMPRQSLASVLEATSEGSDEDVFDL